MKTTPILTLLIAQEDDKSAPMPAAQFLEAANKLNATPTVAAAFCVCALDAFLSRIPDADQTKYEEQFKTIFDTMVKERHEYMDTLQVEQP